MTIQQASKLLGVSVQFIRLALQQGLFPWGSAEKSGEHWIYKIEKDGVMAWKN